MYDFDEIIDRRGTDSVKWDGFESQGKPKDALPMWVADMDFRSPKPVMDALHKRIDHGVYGYTMVSDTYKEAVVNWMSRRHHWQIDSNWIITSPGVVAALKIAVNALTKEKDSIIIQKPVYYPFDFAIALNNRRIIRNYMNYDGSKYTINFEDFEQKIIDHNVKLYILCNPHNPVGRVFTQEELQRLGDICKKHNVIVISDEIHQDIVFKGYTHIPFYNVDPSFKEFSVVFTAPSKTFNLAGLQTSNIIVANEKIRNQLQSQIDKSGISQPNLLGLLACQTAYNECEDWCDEMIAYVEGNIHFMSDFLQTRIPELKMIQPEGTYLVWLDCRALHMDCDALEKFMLEKAKLWLDEGYIFCKKEGAGCERINVAAPRKVIERALLQLEEAVKSIGVHA